MAALTIKIDTSKMTQDLRDRFERLKNKDYLLRPVAIETIPLMTERIHQKGMSSDGAAIGTYSSSYLKLRQEKYNRSADPKVIVALTSQLENDWAVIATEKGYGIGFNNPFNAQKARWVEEIKDKKIFSLSQQEQQFVTERFQELINNAFSS